MIIDDFIRSAQPVGSQSLSKKKEILLSPATIRNEMADLESLGFIEKTHTSSGRSLRKRVSLLCRQFIVSASSVDDINKIHSIFAERMYELENIVQNSARILSELTNYTAILLGPAVKENKLRKLQIVPLNQETAVAILLQIRSCGKPNLYFPQNIAPEEIEKLVNILNHKLQGVPISELRDTIFKEVADLLRKNIQEYEYLLKTITETVDLPAAEKLFFAGKMNILNQPEFHNIDKVRSLLDMIDQKKGLYELFRQAPRGIHVKIGKENNNT